MSSIGQRRQQITVMIVDDVDEMRYLARFAFEADPRWEVVGEAAEGASAILEAARVQPDVVLLDLEMPWLDGPEALPFIRRAAPSCQVVVWTVDVASPRARSALDLGAAAVVSKDAVPFSRLGEELLTITGLSERVAP